MIYLVTFYVYNKDCEGEIPILPYQSLVVKDVDRKLLEKKISEYMEVGKVFRYATIMEQMPENEHVYFGGDVQVLKCRGVDPKLVDIFKKSEGILGGDKKLRLIQRMVQELKDGEDVEAVVDKFVKCKNPLLRQKLIAGIRKMIGDEMLREAGFS